MNRVTSVSRRLTDFVADFEGGQSPDGKFRPYQDAVGVWTIGYGHTQGLVRRLKARTPAWSEAKARRVLRRELDRSYAPAVATLQLPLTQSMFDALVSLIYNVGPGALGPDTGLGQALRRHYWHRAAAEMLRWDKAGGRPLLGLTRRRSLERQMFLSDLP